MQVAGIETTLIAKEMCALARGLPFQSEQGWTFSTDYMANYLREHADNGAGLNSDKAAMMAAGRLEWLLQGARPTLCGMFSEADIMALMDCYLGDMFSPDQMNRLPSDLCDHLGVELDDYEASGIAPLINKLRGLNAVQRMTLADALEQTWHRGMKGEQKHPRDFLASIGIELI